MQVTLMTLVLNQAFHITAVSFKGLSENLFPNKDLQFIQPSRPRQEKANKPQKRIWQLMVWLPLSCGMHRCVDHVWGAAINCSSTFII